MELGAPMRAPVRAKNKMPAPMQITAEQILREAAERQEPETKAPKQKITDPEELAAFCLRKRKGYEDALRINRQHTPHWINYAKFEESQGQFDRARSVFERALEVDHRDKKIWMNYAEMEMRNRHVNAARNVWDRAVTLLPRVPVLWSRYAYMEEMLGNVAGARAVFERWCAWEPEDSAWTSFIRLELRHDHPEGARRIFGRYVQCHAVPRAYVRWAKFEEQQGAPANARAVYEAALQQLRDDCVSDEILGSFAEFEQRQAEYERARAIFTYALGLEGLSAPDREALVARHARFERAHGDKGSVEAVVHAKKRAQYEAAVAAEPLNYDHWFDLCRLEESLGAQNADAVRHAYERAVGSVPPAPRKGLWRRYIFFWIKYALFEELRAKDFARAREVYAACRRLLPHKLFTFGKVWILSARFELRRGQLKAARQILGAGIGLAPKPKIFRAYIQLELQLGEIERCRALYEKFVSWAPHSAAAWIAMAQLEGSLAEAERARALYELAVAQPVLDMPELAWKAYIDFEAALAADAQAEGGGEVGAARVRALYERLLSRTSHVKVWLSLAQWEVSGARGRTADRRAAPARRAPRRALTRASACAPLPPSRRPSRARGRRRTSRATPRAATPPSSARTSTSRRRGSSSSGAPRAPPRRAHAVAPAARRARATPAAPHAPVLPSAPHAHAGWRCSRRGRRACASARSRLPMPTRRSHACSVSCPSASRRSACSSPRTGATAAGRSTTTTSTRTTRPRSRASRSSRWRTSGSASAARGTSEETWTNWRAQSFSTEHGLLVTTARLVSSVVS